MRLVIKKYKWYKRGRGLFGRRCLGSRNNQKKGFKFWVLSGIMGDKFVFDNHYYLSVMHFE